MSQQKGCDVLLLDYSAVGIAAAMMSLKADKSVTLSEDFVRHMVLNTIRANYAKFKYEYGLDLVVACDSGKSWRHEVFPYYKANRVRDKDSSFIDWEALIASLNVVADELKTYFPYRVIKVKNAEADDIIGTLARRFGDTSIPILILSGDKDFAQLQHFKNVTQYSPIAKGYVRTDDPHEFLIEHIIKGDSTDGVPNIMSDDDIMVNPLKGRQKPMTAKRLTAFKNDVPEELKKNYTRNELMINLDNTPSGLVNTINDEYDNQGGKGRKAIYPYMIDRRLRYLLSEIGDF